MESFSSHFYSSIDSILIISLSVSPAGLSVRCVRQRPQCSQPGLPDRQPPDPDRTQNRGDGGDGGDRALRSENRSWEQDGLCSGFNETLLKELSDETGENLSRIFFLRHVEPMEATLCSDWSAEGLAWRSSLSWRQLGRLCQYQSTDDISVCAL